MGYKIILTGDRTLIAEYTSEFASQIPRILIHSVHKYKSLAELRIDPYLGIMEKGKNPLEVAG